MSAENAVATEAEPQLSPVEAMKEQSGYLRGTLAEQVADAAVDHLNETDKNLIKFHGSYQQEDRDARKNRGKAGVGKAYMFMLRLKLPGGKMSADQYLAMDDIAGKYANGTLRVTTRQSFQFHGVLKNNLKATIAGINDVFLSTLGACGDINRNVVSCPAPLGDATRRLNAEMCQAVAEGLTPRAAKQVYHEVWLNGEKVDPETAEEPLYGKTYLPRKFKTGFALPEDNCTDVLAQCLGFLAASEKGKPIGYDMYVGGGQGQTNSKPDTYPLLAQPVGFLDPSEVVEAAQAVVRLFRDHGNRADRKRARLKYVMKDWGVEKFREVFYRDYFPHPARLPELVPITGLDLHHGWNPMGGGKWFLGLSVENGRIKDDGSLRMRSGLRAIVSRFKADVRLTTQQDVLVCGIATADRSAVDSLLNEYGIPRPDTLPMVQKWGMACPAIPTCGLAITEAERALPGVVKQLEAVLADLGLAAEPISVRMTGCPNGCARPYQSEVGIVGRGGTKYTLYIGGDSFGRRLNTEVQDSVPIEQIAPKLAKVFAAFKAERKDEELFGSYCDRVGLAKLKELVGATA